MQCNQCESPVFAGGLCRLHYGHDLRERRLGGEVITAGPARRAERVEHPCEHCGAVMSLTGDRRERAEAGRKVYCSRACQKAENRVEAICIACGAPFQARPRRELGPDARRFCSNACRMTQSKPRVGTTGPCDVCGTPVYRNRSSSDGSRFCTRECKSQSQRGVAKVEPVTMSCEICDETFQVAPHIAANGRRTCSRKCGGILRRRTERYVDSNGYAWITDEHGKNRSEHRWAMEQVLGRALRKDENIHHVDGVKDNNSTDGVLRLIGGHWQSGNLELWSTSQPSGQRVPDKVSYAVDVLRLYALDKGWADDGSLVALGADLIARHASILAAPAS